MRLFLIVITGIVLSCTDRESKKRYKTDNQFLAVDSLQRKIGANYHIEIINSTNGFGYSIRAGEALLIYQPTIPGLSGNEGFKSPSDALRVANCAVSKMEHGIFPPSISLKELDSLGVNVSDTRH